MAQGKKDAVDYDITVRFRVSSKLYEDAQALTKKRGIKFSQLMRDLLVKEIEAAQNTPDK